jgi:hypothetical protein
MKMLLDEEERRNSEIISKKRRHLLGRGVPRRFVSAISS